MTSTQKLERLTLEEATELFKCEHNKLNDFNLNNIKNNE